MRCPRKKRYIHHSCPLNEDIVGGPVTQPRESSAYCDGEIRLGEDTTRIPDATSAIGGYETERSAEENIRLFADIVIDEILTMEDLILQFTTLGYRDELTVRR